MEKNHKTGKCPKKTGINSSKKVFDTTKESYVLLVGWWDGGYSTKVGREWSNGDAATCLGSWLDSIQKQGEELDALKGTSCPKLLAEFWTSTIEKIDKKKILMSQSSKKLAKAAFF